MTTHTDAATAQYVPGEEIQITLKGQVTAHDEAGLVIQVAADWYFTVLPTDTTAAAITRLIPAEGIPQVGDLWRDCGDVDWFVRDCRRMLNGEGKDLPWTVVNDSCGPLRLIYRPGPTADHLPAEAEVAS
jgi:hypothetical protein